MASKSIQCGFESHPGHSRPLPRRHRRRVVGTPAEHGGMYPGETRRAALELVSTGLSLNLPDLRGRGRAPACPRGCTGEAPTSLGVDYSALLGVCHVPAPGAVVVQNCWKHWPCLLPQHGPGRKHERALGMQPVAVGDRRAASRRVPAGAVPLRRRACEELGDPAGAATRSTWSASRGGGPDSERSPSRPAPASPVWTGS